MRPLREFRITPRHAATVVAVAASLYFSASQLHNQKVRQQRDLESSSALLADGLREAVEPLLGEPRGRLQELADRFGRRGHLAGIAVFDEKGRLLARSASLRSSVATPPRLAAQALTRGKEESGYETIGARRLRINSVPLVQRGATAGVLTVFHDPAFIEARMARTRTDAAVRMLLQAALFLAAVWLFGLFIK